MPVQQITAKTRPSGYLRYSLWVPPSAKAMLGVSIMARSRKPDLRPRKAIGAHLHEPVGRHFKCLSKDPETAHGEHAWRLLAPQFPASQNHDLIIPLRTPVQSSLWWSEMSATPA